MRILVMQASPNEDGLTAGMAKQALAGAQAAGAETELVHLRKLKLPKQLPQRELPTENHIHP